MATKKKTEPYEPKIGDWVKDGTKGQYASVGKIVSFNKGDATVEIPRKFGGDVEGLIPRANLIHVCSRYTHSGWDVKVCGRPIKENGLCGIHAGAQKRSDNARAKWQAGWDAQKARSQKVAHYREQVTFLIEQTMFESKAVFHSLDENDEPLVLIPWSELRDRISR